jgi:hypothetical protein
MSLITLQEGETVGLISTTRQSALGNDGISAFFYPLSIKLEQNKRITKRDNLEGSVIQHFTNRYGNNNDLLELSIQCSTRNVDSKITNTTFEDVIRVNNLENFYKIMTLAEETPYFAGNAWNYAEIQLASPILRNKKIFLFGFFKEMPEIVEKGENQKFVEFNMEFWILNRSRIDFNRLRKDALDFKNTTISRSRNDPNSRSGNG